MGAFKLTFKGGLKAEPKQLGQDGLKPLVTLTKQVEPASLEQHENQHASFFDLYDGVYAYG